MTQAEVDALSIGDACAWHHDKVIHRSDETAIAYRINGLSPHLNLIAELGPTHGLGRWAFYVYRGTEPLHPKNSFGSREQAFAALKDWLLQNPWDHPHTLASRGG